jgi:hypothetical protein
MPPSTRAFLISSSAAEKFENYRMTPGIPLREPLEGNLQPADSSGLREDDQGNKHMAKPPKAAHRVSLAKGELSLGLLDEAQRPSLHIQSARCAST